MAYKHAIEKEIWNKNISFYTLSSSELPLLKKNMGNNLRTQKTELQLFFFISQPFKKYKPLSILKNVHRILIQHPQHYKTKETQNALHDRTRSSPLTSRGALARRPEGGCRPPVQHRSSPNPTAGPVLRGPRCSYVLGTAVELKS